LARTKTSPSVPSVISVFKIPSADQAITRKLSAWFRKHARDLPWRTIPRDPYLSLVSELMLHQTQVSRVLEKFPAFIERFPTIHALASAPEERILEAWSGLGYYRRASLLQSAARAIVEDHDGKLPQTLAALQQLPGLGRYTAGALASIVFNQPAPIVDGNVTRVLLRLDGKPLRHASKQATDHAWSRAESLVRRAAHPAAFNEGLMELGALVCTPKNPRCEACPLKTHCRARAANTQHKIPLPKQQGKRETLHLAACIITNKQGRVLLERRPPTGLWPGLWQPPTIESPKPIKQAQLAAHFPFALARRTRLTETTTHRDVRITVYAASATTTQLQTLKRTRPAAKLTAPRQLPTLAMGNAQRKILQTSDLL
jgi:A/G-specific adenine glycosylase